MGDASQRAHHLLVGGDVSPLGQHKLTPAGRPFPCMMPFYAQPSGIFARCSLCATHQLERLCQDIPGLASQNVFHPFVHI